MEHVGSEARELRAQVFRRRDYTQKGIALVRQSFRNADGENHPRSELQLLSGRPSESVSMNVEFGNQAWQSAALSGRICRRCFPRPEGLGYSVFALRATAECRNSTRGVLFATPPNRELQATPLQKRAGIEGIRESAIFCCLEMKERHLA